MRNPARAGPSRPQPHRPKQTTIDCRLFFFFSRWYRSQTGQYGHLLLPLVTSGHALQRTPPESTNAARHRLIGGTLIVSSVGPEDRGRYVCAVNNSMGLVESRTELVFRDKVHVRITQPVAAAQGQLNSHGRPFDQHVQVVDAETSVTITCLYSGSPRFR